MSQFITEDQYLHTDDIYIDEEGYYVDENGFYVDENGYYIDEYGDYVTESYLIEAKNRTEDDLVKDIEPGFTDSIKRRGRAIKDFYLDDFKKGRKTLKAVRSGMPGGYAQTAKHFAKGAGKVGATAGAIGGIGYGVNKLRNRN